MPTEIIETKFKSGDKTVEIVKIWTEAEPHWYVKIFVDSILTYDGWAFNKEDK